MDPCLQQDRLSSIEDSIKSMMDTVNVMNSSITLIREQMKGFSETLIDHEHVLRGSGNEPGLIAQNSQAVEIMADLRDVLRGKGDQPGLISVVRKLAEADDKKADWDKWLIRLLAGAVLTYIVAQVLQFLVK